ncbi:hypothetical protein O181_015087 [Austropuccinia psidii MF-1]|uniref:Integrase catalytic domain-containing protein n=1 Tax=Austropuccinia psidii MF-1 TaxID=1389203 RepID=A0A9Q3C1G0_9BASI|nr:hypothetical protein [Austropuccinia psidii MF-1]
MAASGSATPQNFCHQSEPQKSKQPSTRIPIGQQSKSWARYHLSPRFPCLHCFEWGHWVQDCKRKKAGLPAVKDPQKKNPNAILKKSSIFSHPCIAEVEVEDEEPLLSSIQQAPGYTSLVLLDSGATHHVTENATLFSEYKKIDLTLSVASAKQHLVVGKGIINLACPSGNLRLTEVLHCPNIPGTVISISKFVRNDGGVKFEEGLFKLIQNSCTHYSLLKGERWFLCLGSKMYCNAISDYSKDFLRLLHRRLAHLSLRTVRRMQRLQSARGLPPKIVTNDEHLCPSCSLAKSKHSPLQAESRQIVQAPGDMVVTDLMGPFPVSMDKKVYSLLVQDHYSSLTTFYPLKAKSEAANFMIGWIEKFNNLTKYTVKCLRSDNGGEFSSQCLKKYLDSKGIVHERTIPYKHHQAGKIERTNRTIAEAAQSMLVDSSLSIELWPYAFRQAVWVFNRVLHGTSILTPYQQVTGRTPDLTPLKIFGCKAYVHNLLHRKDLTPKARELIHIGISEDSKGWLFWDDARRQIVKGALAVFDENKRQVVKGRSLEVSTINIQNIFDPSMINKIGYQDEQVELMNVSASLHSDAPGSYGEGLASADQQKWREAISTEIASMDKMEVWTEVPKNVASSVLGTRWVFTVKRDPVGRVTQYKARIVVQGHRQIKGLNFDETFAPTPTFTSLQCLFAAASKFNWPVQTFDVTTAYLHSNVEEDVYVQPPPGMCLKEGAVLKLRKVLYGLKQAGRFWWKHLSSILRDMGFVSNQEDQSLYVYRMGNDVAMMWVHVDDGVLTANREQVMDCLKNDLQARLQLKWDKGIHSIVGVEVARDGGRFFLHQTALIDKVYGMLLYLAQATRPDIMFLVNYLARFLMGTTSKHWVALEHLINYLRGTRNKKLEIETDNREAGLKIFVDANWGGEGSRSQHGFIGFLWGAPISWNSKRQTCVASSACQAEYMARAGMWITQIMSAIQQGMVPALLPDNKAVIQIATNSGSRKNSRHIRREFHLINEMITMGQVSLDWVNSDEQKADIFTKKLGRQKVRQSMEKILLECFVEGSVNV